MEPQEYDETPIYTQLRKEYAALERFRAFFRPETPNSTPTERPDLHD